MEYLAFLAT